MKLKIIKNNDDCKNEFERANDKSDTTIYILLRSTERKLNTVYKYLLCKYWLCKYPHTNSIPIST